MSTGLPLDDVQQIFAVLTVLYALECCWWLRGDARRFFSWPCGRLTDRPSDGPLASGWRLTMGNPWPGGEAFVSEPFPFPFDDERLLIPVIQSETGRERYRAFEYDSLDPIIVDNRAVLAGDRVIGDFSSHALAVSIAETLERVRNAPPDKRQQIASEALAERWSQPLAGHRLAAWRQASGLTRVLGSMLVVLGLLIGPLAYAGRGELPAWLPPGLLLAFLGLWLATALAGLQLGASLASSDPHRTTHRLVPFLSPASAMRLSETSGRDVLACYEPLVVALVTSDDSGAESVASAWFRQAVYPPHDSHVAADPPVIATLTRYRRECEGHARRAVEAASRDPEQLLKAPAAGDDAAAYCRRCLRLFQAEAAECPTCGLAATPFQRIKDSPANADTSSIARLMSGS